MPVPETTVLELRSIDGSTLDALLAPAGLDVVMVDLAALIPGSHWGEPEAGLIGSTLNVRKDTPVHSALHEACHWLLMDAVRRTGLNTDAGGTPEEENAVCLLQLVLADALPPMHFERMANDMDAWGYSFRLGSTRSWYMDDADDARRALGARLDRFALAPPVMRLIRRELEQGPISGSRLLPVIG